ncbi:cupin domain-containing protein [Comamonas sp. NLF-1-9]|uniref:cupin domain-containing protein n=1 Tax=Comamonas sp. NLF-1-9 TaxID=2853163 RepID=UPI001C477B33|nr:cupin domain-containing protein [Comamonas sp. NLF-1-9]QXL85677.1 cupin domain-containing protein [Comamonas sp. NLF-1-9]
MALPHALSSEVVSLQPLGARIADTRTHAIIKAEQLEVVRVVLPAGSELPLHETPGEITLYCIEGEVQFTVAGQPRPLRAGDWIHLQPRAPHALRATRDASLLLTICLLAGEA